MTIENDFFKVHLGQYFSLKYMNSFWLSPVWQNAHLERFKSIIFMKRQIKSEAVFKFKGTPLFKTESGQLVSREIWLRKFSLYCDLHFSVRIFTEFQLGKSSRRKQKIPSSLTMPWNRRPSGGCRLWLKGSLPFLCHALLNNPCHAAVMIRNNQTGVGNAAQWLLFA